MSIIDINRGMLKILSRISNHQSKVIRYGVPLSVLLIIILIGVILAFSKTVSLPSQLTFQKGPKVEQKTEYKNPFAKETQYVNPFKEYKNPFVVSR